MLHTPSGKRVIPWLGLITVALATTGPAQAIPVGAAAGEVESLIAYVSGLTTARFRGGRFEVGSTNAVSSLRHELAAKGDKVSNAQEFIRWRATRWEDTGQIYGLLLPGGVVRPAADVL